MENIIEQISENLNIKAEFIRNTVKLLDEGSTVPFIARYRKEQTGNLKDIEIRDIEENLNYLRSLEERKSDILRLIAENTGVEVSELDKNLVKQIKEATTLTRLEDLYRPYRSTRKTRASVAKKKGLEPLANIIFKEELSQEQMIEIINERFIDVEKEVETSEEAIQGAQDIIAEFISNNPTLRDMVRSRIFRMSTISTEATDNEEKSVYEMYYDYNEKLNSVPDHRVLAINRGEKEKYLRVSINTPIDMGDMLASQLVGDNNCYTRSLYREAILDGYNRLMFPSLEREIRNTLTEKAEENSIKVFATNLKPLLMQSPLRNKRILGVDPGFRTGCKLAALDETGRLLDYDTIYPVPPREDIDGSKKTMMDFIDRYDLDIVVIGNGTASRETENVVAQMIVESGRDDLSYSVISEAGASVYSASEVGRMEFPDLDVSIRGAVSIGRRIQDPLAELVKIDPKSIGVGQYQHDLNQKNLEDALAAVVEDSVNAVGVDLNTASPSLLGYVSGISKRVASNIVDYRNEIGRFEDRAQLLDVPGIGPKTYEQAAGFLRIPDGNNVLDNTGIHPESYGPAKVLLDQDLDNVEIISLSKELEVGELTLSDMIEELKKPGRDPRDEMPPPILRSDILTIDDLEEGLVMKGTVRNVVDFGAFVDIGVEQDGLIHISNISDSYIKDISDVIEVGQIVDVKILEIDRDKGRIGLTMKDV